MNTKNIGYIITGLAIIISAYLLSNAWKVTHRGRSVITVTGMSALDFNSNLIVWDASFCRKSNNLREANALIKEDVKKIHDYFISKGLKEDEIVFDATRIEQEYETVELSNERQIQKFIGYKLSKSVNVESKNIDAVLTVSREITDLINEGIEVYSGATAFYNTNLGEIKIKLLAEATANARQRAEKIAEQAGADLGKLKSADMGIFQITAQNGNEDYSWGGTLNTSSYAKTASITVDLEYLID